MLLKVLSQGRASRIKRARIEGDELFASNANSAINKDCEITNNASKSVVTIIPSVAKAPDEVSLLDGYNQTLEILPLKAGGNAIATGQSGEIVLNQSYTPEGGSATYSTQYDLLLSGTSSDWFYPVANKQVTAVNDAYAAQSASVANETAMTEASSFYQTISVYPTSKLATDFQAAMKAGLAAGIAQADGSPQSSANIANTLEDAVEKFFKGSKSYKNVTLFEFTAIDSYYKKFPFVWSQYNAADKPYYLYSSDGTTKRFIGMVNLQKPNQIDVTSDNGGYTCTFSPAVNPDDLKSVSVDSTKAKSLIYANGLFVDDINKDVPDIGIKGTFQLENLFNNDPKDNTVIPVLTGQVNGITCAGRDESQVAEDKPKSFKEILDLMLEIGAALVFLPATILLIKNYYLWARDRNAPTTREQLNEMETRLTDQFNSELDRLYNDLTGGDLSPPSSTDDGLSMLSESELSFQNMSSLRNLSHSSELLDDNLNTLNEYSDSFSSSQAIEMQGIGSRLSRFSSALEPDIPPNLEYVDSLSSSFSSLSSDMLDFSEQISSEMSERDIRKFKESASESRSIIDDVSESIKNESDLPFDEDPSADDIQPIEEL